MSESTLDTRPLAEAPIDPDAPKARGARPFLYAGGALLVLAAAFAGVRAWRAPDAVTEPAAAPATEGTAARERLPEPKPPAEPAPQPTPPDLARIATAAAPAGEHDSPQPEEEPSAAVAAQEAQDSPRRATGRGFVNVATPGGWADVYVSGRHRGKTPLQLTLPEGRRTLVLRPFGQKPQRRTILVRKEQLTRLVVSVHESR